MDKLSLGDSNCNDDQKALASILKEPKYTRRQNISDDDDETSTACSKNKVMKGKVLERQQCVPDLQRQQMDKSLNFEQDKVQTCHRPNENCIDVNNPTMNMLASKSTCNDITNCDEQAQQKQDKNRADKPFSISSLISKRQALQEEENQNLSMSVEADVDFCCMTAEDYEKALVEADADDESSCSADELNLEENGADFFVSPSQLEEKQLEGLSKMEKISQIMFGDLEAEEVLPAPEPRPFLKLWQALSSWMSPLTTELLLEWRKAGADWDYSSVSPSRLYDRSDIGSSRCIGLMSILKMNLPSALSELKSTRDSDVYIAAEKKIGEIARTFNFSEPMAKFDDPRMWKVATIIFLEIVLITHRPDPQNCHEPHIPPSVLDVGMTMEEYQYLCLSAMTNLPDLER